MPKPPQRKRSQDMTTDEAMSRLFHPDAVEHLKTKAREADDRGEKRAKGSSRGRSVIKNDGK